MTADEMIDWLVDGSAESRAIIAKLRAADELAAVLDKWDNGFISGREARKKVKAAKDNYRAAGKES